MKTLKDLQQLEDKQSMLKQEKCLFKKSILVKVIYVSIAIISMVVIGYNICSNKEEKNVELICRGIEERCYYVDTNIDCNYEDAIKCENKVIDLDSSKIKNESILKYIEGLKRQNESIKTKTSSWEKEWNEGYYERCVAINEMVKEDKLLIHDEVYANYLKYLIDVEVGKEVDGQIAFVSQTNEGDYSCTVSVTNITGRDLENVHLKMDWGGEVIERNTRLWNVGSEWVITWNLPKELLLQGDIVVLVGITEFTVSGIVKSDNTYLGQVCWKY